MAATDSAKKVLDNIKTLRKEKGISQKEVAEYLSMHQAGYNRIENGTAELSLVRLYQIAEILGVSVQEILAGSSDGSRSAPDVEALKKENESLRASIVTQAFFRGLVVRFCSFAILPILSHFAPTENPRNMIEIDGERFIIIPLPRLKETLHAALDYLDTIKMMYKTSTHMEFDTKEISDFETILAKFVAIKSDIAEMWE